MRRTWWSLGLTIGLAPLTVSGQESSNALPIRAIPLTESTQIIAVPNTPNNFGAPKAKLGLPESPSSSPEYLGIPSGLERASAIIRGQSTDPMDLKIPEVDPKKTEKKILPKASITESKEPIPAPKTSETLTPNPVVQPSIVNPVPGLTSPVMSSPVVDCERPLCNAPTLGLMNPTVAERNTLTVEYLHWWLKSGALPVLVTTGPSGSGGILGNAGVVPIFGGGSDLAPTFRPGLRVNFTRWFQNGIWGFDGTFFGLASRGDEVFFYSNQYPVLARPFTSQNTINGTSTTLPTLPGPVAELTTAPGVGTGYIGIKTESLMWGMEANLRRKLLYTCNANIDFLVGYRYVGLTESLEVTEVFQGAPNSAFDGVAGTIRDSFRTANHFHGANVGFKYESQRGRWHLGATAKIAFGVTQGTTDTQGGLRQYGSRILPVSAQGGLLALGSNIGEYKDYHFGVVPEGGLNLGYDINDHWRFTVGYTFMYWNRVFRPGDQVDTTLDITRIPILNDPTLVPDIAKVRPMNSIRPYPMQKATDIWAQGINFSLSAKW